MVLVAPLMALSPSQPALASVSSIVVQAAPTGGVQTQVQIPVPHIDFNTTQWVQDAFSALLQSFTDGIRAGMEAIWAANSSHRPHPP
jgi:hypothetical protein